MLVNMGDLPQPENDVLSKALASRIRPNQQNEDHALKSTSSSGVALSGKDLQRYREGGGVAGSGDISSSSSSSSSSSIAISNHDSIHPRETSVGSESGGVEASSRAVYLPPPPVPSHSWTGSAEVTNNAVGVAADSIAASGAQSQNSSKFCTSEVLPNELPMPLPVTRAGLLEQTLMPSLKNMYFPETNS